VEAGIASGFQMAAGAGPMCDEPLWGVALEVEARLNGCGWGGGGGGPDGAADAAATIPAPPDAQESVYGPLAGQVAAASRTALRAAVAAAHPRLVEPTLLCEVTAAEAGALGGVYAALGRRRARVLREDLREGAGVFSILAHLPAAGALGLAGDLRARTGGAASASLLLSHWARLAADPYFVPTTEEQREEYGEEGQGAGAPNIARAAVDAVRVRKGLPVAARVVESATKQRTRARKV
jgi:ribosome assembly protein 1